MGMTSNKNEPTSTRELLATVLFDSGSVVLKKNARDILSHLLAQLKEKQDLAVYIEGHTDIIGGAEINREISLKRAQAVVKWLTARGITQNRLRVVALGNKRPISSNKTLQGRAANRRVEIVKMITQRPVVFFPKKSFQFQPVVDGTEVRHDYAIQNKGKAPLVISKIKTG